MTTAKAGSIAEPMVEEVGAAVAPPPRRKDGNRAPLKNRCLPTEHFPGKGIHRPHAYVAPTAGCRGAARLLAARRRVK